MTKLVFLIPLVLLACASSPNKSVSSPSNAGGSPDIAPVSSTGSGTVPCSQEIALECPAGQVDACTLSPAESDHHVCVQQ